MTSGRKFSTEDLSALFDEAPYGVVAIGATGLIEYVNPYQCENSRLSREFLLGKHHRSMFYRPLDEAGLLPLYDRLVAEGTPFSATVLDYKRLSDGERVAFTMRGHRSAGWIFLVSGIERLLAEQQRRYQQLFENANDGIFILSPEGTFVAANRKIAEMTGVPIKDLIGQTTEMFLPEHFADSLKRIERIMRDGHFGPFELEITLPARGKRFFSLSAFALLEDGKPCGVISIARDTTEEHRIAKELRTARDQALEASRLKTAFLANMSHEIRTPLNVIVGYSSLLGDNLTEIRDPNEREIFESMQCAARRLIDTVDSILDISKIETGAFAISPARVELAPLVHQEVHAFLQMARAKGLTLCCEISEPGAAVTFDRYCLEHALMNLLSNAIKFTHSGGVRLELTRDSQRKLCLRVRDTGVGIDAAFLPKLCEPFMQEETGPTRPFDGNGLGLALTKRYLELNGARLSVESEKGKGSLLTIHFNSEVPSDNRP